MAGRRPDPFKVLPANWAAFQVFLAQGRRWRHRPNGEPEGLDHAQIESTVRLMRIRKRHWPQVLWRLSVLEKAALLAMGF